MQLPAQNHSKMTAAGHKIVLQDTPNMPIHEIIDGKIQINGSPVDSVNSGNTFYYERTDENDQLEKGLVECYNGGTLLKAYVKKDGVVSSSTSAGETHFLLNSDTNGKKVFMDFGFGSAPPENNYSGTTFYCTLDYYKGSPQSAAECTEDKRVSLIKYDGKPQFFMKPQLNAGLLGFLVDIDGAVDWDKKGDELFPEFNIWTIDMTLDAAYRNVSGKVTIAETKTISSTMFSVSTYLEYKVPEPKDDSDNKDSGPIKTIAAVYPLSGIALNSLSAAPAQPQTAAMSVNITSQAIPDTENDKGALLEQEKKLNEQFQKENGLQANMLAFKSENLNTENTVKGVVSAAAAAELDKTPYTMSVDALASLPMPAAEYNPAAKEVTPGNYIAQCKTMDIISKLAIYSRAGETSNGISYADLFHMTKDAAKSSVEEIANYPHSADEDSNIYDSIHSDAVNEIMDLVDKDKATIQFLNDYADALLVQSFSAPDSAYADVFPDDTQKKLEYYFKDSSANHKDAFSNNPAFNKLFNVIYKYAYAKAVPGLIWYYKDQKSGKTDWAKLLFIYANQNLPMLAGSATEAGNTDLLNHYSTILNFLDDGAKYFPTDTGEGLPFDSDEAKKARTERAEKDAKDKEDALKDTSEGEDGEAGNSSSSDSGDNEKKNLMNNSDELYGKETIYNYASKLYANAYNYQIAHLQNHINLDQKTNSAVDIDELTKFAVDETMKQLQGTSDKQANPNDDNKKFFEECLADDFGKLVKMDPGKAREQLMTMTVEFVQLASQLGDFAKTTKLLGESIQKTENKVIVGMGSAVALGLLQAAFGAIMLVDWKKLDIKEKIMAVAGTAFGLFSSLQYIAHLKDIEIQIYGLSKYPKLQVDAAESRNNGKLYRNDQGEIMGFSAEASAQYRKTSPTEGRFATQPEIVKVMDENGPEGSRQVRDVMMVIPDPETGGIERLQNIYKVADRAIQGFNVLILGLFAATQTMTLIDAIKKKDNDDIVAEVFYYTLESISILALGGAAAVEGVQMVGGIVQTAGTSVAWLSKMAVAGGLLGVLTMVAQIGAMIAHSFYSDQLKIFVKHALADNYVAKMSAPPEGWEPVGAATA